MIMNTFKITNITNLANKRGGTHNMNVDVEYVDNLLKKKINLKPGETFYLTTQKLPTSIYKLQVKSLISITEVSGNELKNLKNDQPKQEAKVNQEIETPLESTKKRNKKETESK